jgi:hypothetical protein
MAFAFAPFSLLIATDPTQFAQQLEAGESILSAGLVVGILIAIIPIAFATSIIRYRSWKFFVVHTEAFGEVNLDRMTQSDDTIVRKPWRRPARRLRRRGDLMATFFDAWHFDGQSAVRRKVEIQAIGNQFYPARTGKAARTVCHLDELRFLEAKGR